MKLGIVITQTDPETVFNVLRLASYSISQGDEVKIFLSGRGVELEKIQDPKFDVKKLAQEVLQKGAKFFACTTCIKLRDKTGSEICPLSSLKDHYEIVRDSDRLITV
jgi:predicted peroxiredoxin